MTEPEPVDKLQNTAFTRGEDITQEKVDAVRADIEATLVRMKQFDPDRFGSEFSKAVQQMIGAQYRLIIKENGRGKDERDIQLFHSHRTLSAKLTELKEMLTNAEAVHDDMLSNAPGATLTPAQGTEVETELSIEGAGMADVAAQHDIVEGSRLSYLGGVRSPEDDELPEVVEKEDTLPLGEYIKGVMPNDPDISFEMMPSVKIEGSYAVVFNVPRERVTNPVRLTELPEGPTIKVGMTIPAGTKKTGNEVRDEGYARLKEKYVGLIYLEDAKNAYEELDKALMNLAVIFGNKKLPNADHTTQWLTTQLWSRGPQPSRVNELVQYVSFAQKSLLDAEQSYKDSVSGTGSDISRKLLFLRFSEFKKSTENMLELIALLLSQKESAPHDDLPIANGESKSGAMQLSMEDRALIDVFLKDDKKNDVPAGGQTTQEQVIQSRGVTSGLRLSRADKELIDNFLRGNK